MPTTSTAADVDQIDVEDYAVTADQLRMITDHVLKMSAPQRRDPNMIRGRDLLMRCFNYDTFERDPVPTKKRKIEKQVRANFGTKLLHFHITFLP